MYRILILLLVAGGLCMGAPRPNIVVEDNLIAENGLGIYLGWGGDWYIRVTGNRIERNGEGIRIVNRMALIEGNLIADNVIGVRITSEHEEKTVTEVEWVTLRGNSFVGNELYALQNLSPVTVEADDNWWGDPSGPRRAFSEWILVPLVLRVPTSPSLELSVSPVSEASPGPALSLEGLGREPQMSPNSFGIELKTQYRWGWRIALLPQTIASGGNLVLGSVKCEYWSTEPLGVREE